MMDERERVIRDLNAALAKAGINPDRPFTVTFHPDGTVAFSSDESAATGSSSSLREGNKVEKR